MDRAYLFITAPEADGKILNRLAVLMMDWHSGGAREFMEWTQAVATRDDFPDCLDPEGPFVAPVNPDLPSINEWAGASMEEVEAYMMHQRSLRRDVSPYFVVVDERGVAERSCVLASCAMVDLDTEEMIAQGRIFFAKLRMPWYAVCNSWINLDVANKGLDDFSIAPTVDREGWYGGWRTTDFAPGSEPASDAERRARDERRRNYRERDRWLKELEDAGRA